MASTSTDDAVETVTIKIENNSVCECIICDLLLKQSFFTRSLEEQDRIIVQGRLTPDLNLLAESKGANSSFITHFASTLYSTYDWIAGCQLSTRLFCWPCLLFNPDPTPWNSAGFSDLNSLHKLIRKHLVNQTHLEAVLREKSFGKIRINHAIDRQLTLNRTQHNELVNKNRTVIKNLIDITRDATAFLGECSSSGVYKTMQNSYDSLIKLLTAYNTTLKNNLPQSTVINGRLSQTQISLVNCIGAVVLKKITNEIKEAAFVSVILSDETTDFADQNVLSVVIRYVNARGSVQDRFVGLQNITEPKTARYLDKIVCDLADTFKCACKLIAYSYDGSTLLLPEFEKFQAYMKYKFKDAKFVHCFNHELHLVLAQSLSVIKECKVFFATLAEMSCFFSKSTKLTKALNDQLQKDSSDNQSLEWKYNGKLIGTIFKFREALIELFENVLASKDNWDGRTVNASRGYLDLLQNDFEFNFLLVLLSEIFPDADDLFDTLQTRMDDVGFCVQKIQKFIATVWAKKSNSYHVWEWATVRCNNSSNQRKRARIDITDSKTGHKLFCTVIDNLVEQLNQRFKNFIELNFVELLCMGKHSKTPITFPTAIFDSFCKHYDDFFDSKPLCAQLKVLYKTKQTNVLNCLGVLTFIKDNGLAKSFQETYLLCQLILTVPVNKASSDNRDCSVFDRIKTFVGCMSAEQQVSSLTTPQAILWIENDLVRSLCENPRFYVDVIEEFAAAEKRIDFTFK